MARGTTPPPEDFEEHIVDIDVGEEMRTSFLEYAYSVIYSRALPDARDGLKPVQRRIVYQMSQMGLRPDRPHVKSARVVGDVMGHLHPHGDAPIYDALVRLAQPWSMRMPLVDSNGNFGSPGNDPAAAMRYTECKMAPLSMEMVRDIDEETVDFTDNYDGRSKEPSVLPARFPNLLINGSAGIAVGIGVHGHRLDAHLAGRLDDAAGDLAAVGDQDLVEHGCSHFSPSFPRRRESRPASKRKHWIPACAGMTRAAITAGCSRACATGSPASCRAASPTSGRCACGSRAAGSRRR